MLENLEKKIQEQSAENQDLIKKSTFLMPEVKFNGTSPEQKLSNIAVSITKNNSQTSLTSSQSNNMTQTKPDVKLQIEVTKEKERLDDLKDEAFLKKFNENN